MSCELAYLYVSSQTLTAKHKTGETYDYEVGICTDVGKSDKTGGCGVVQYTTNHSYCLGRINSSQIARSKSYIVAKMCNDCEITASDGVWIELTYTNGDHYHTHCDKIGRMVRIAFLCDPLVHGMVSFLH